MRSALETFGRLYAPGLPPSIPSLNNEDCAAPPPFPQTLEEAASRIYAPKNLLDGPQWLQTDKTVMRNYMDQALKAKYPSIAWSESYWDIYRTYQWGAADQFGLNAKRGEFGPDRFFKCHWVHKKGAIIADGRGNLFRIEDRCGQPACWHCDDKSRKRVAIENIEIWHNVMENHQGGKGSEHMVFTLPEEVEDCHLWPNAKDIKKALADKIDRIIKLMHGRKIVRGRRSNIAYNLAAHPVGDRDIYRPRLHYHADILPSEIVAPSKGQPRQFNWLQLDSRIIDKSAGHRPDNWKINVKKARLLWKWALQDVFGRHFKKVANPQYKFRPFGPGDLGRERWKKQVAHTLKYNYRSFATDLQRVAIRGNFSKKLVVIKCQDVRLDVQYHRVLTAWELAAHHKWIRKENKIRGRGWLHNRERYIEDGILKVNRPEPEEPPTATYPVQSAEIETQISREYVAGKFLWKKRRIWRFYNMHKDCREEVDEWDETGREQLRPWIWGPPPGGLI